jgi:nitroreductase
MFENITTKHSDSLDEILNARRSVRAFSFADIGKKEIEQIARAGLRAPFASIPARGKPDFRKIIVIPTKTEAMKKVALSIDRLSPKFIEELKENSGGEPMPMMGPDSGGIFRLIGNAPYLIIAGERKGYPPTYMADQSISLSYCMYTMWLKATTLKIGFRLITLFAHLRIGNDRVFCDLLGIPNGEYALDACAIGYPAETFTPPMMKYPDYDDNVVWLEDPL